MVGFHNGVTLPRVVYLVVKVHEHVNEHVQTLQLNMVE